MKKYGEKGLLNQISSLLRAKMIYIQKSHMCLYKSIKREIGIWIPPMISLQMKMAHEVVLYKHIYYMLANIIEKKRHFDHIISRNEWYLMIMCMNWDIVFILYAYVFEV